MKRIRTQFAVCLDDSGYEVSLIPGKLYQVLPDPRAARDHMVRVVDESGEGYLFDRARFLLVDLPLHARRKILALQRAS